MKVTMMFVRDASADWAWLNEAYDEATFDEHGGVPKYYKSQLRQMQTEGLLVQEVVVDIPLDYDDICRPTEVSGTATAVDTPTNRDEAERKLREAGRSMTAYDKNTLDLIFSKETNNDVHK